MKMSILVLMVMGLDILTGTIMAAKNRELDSSKMREGIYKKLGNCILVVCAYGMDYAQAAYGISFGVDVFTCVCVGITVMEFISILENVGKINPDLIKLIRPYLKKLKEENDKK